MSNSKICVLIAAFTYAHIRTSVWALEMFVLLVVGSTIGFAQPMGKTAMKFGLELGNYLSTQSGSFHKEPGFTASLSTGFCLVGDSKSSLSLGVEVSFTRIIRYRPGHEFDYSSDYKLYRFVMDERFMVSSLEIGLLPTYFYSLDDRITLGLYAGPSVGIGKEHLTTNTRSSSVIDTLNYAGAPYPPYGEYNMGPYRTTTSLNIGLGCWYGSFVFDVRYKYSYANPMKEVNNFKNFYTQVGFVF